MEVKFPVAAYDGTEATALRVRAVAVTVSRHNANKHCCVRGTMMGSGVLCKCRERVMTESFTRAYP